MHQDSNKTATITANTLYINIPLLYSLAYTNYDPDGYEYGIDLFDLVRLNETNIEIFC